MPPGARQHRTCCCSAREAFHELDGRDLFALAGTAILQLDPILEQGDEAFVLVGDNALHLRHLDVTDGVVTGTIVHAWALPPAGAVALADERFIENARERVLVAPSID